MVITPNIHSAKKSLLAQYVSDAPPPSTPASLYYPHTGITFTRSMKHIPQLSKLYENVEHVRA